MNNHRIRPGVVNSDLQVPVVFPSHFQARLEDFSACMDTKRDNLTNFNAPLREKTIPCKHSCEHKVYDNFGKGPYLFDFLLTCSRSTVSAALRKAPVSKSYSDLRISERYGGVFRRVRGTRFWIDVFDYVSLRIDNIWALPRVMNIIVGNMQQYPLYRFEDWKHTINTWTLNLAHSTI